MALREKSMTGLSRSIELPDVPRVSFDINSYIQECLREDPRFRRWEDHWDIKLHIETLVAEKSSGIPHLAHCQLDTLASSRTLAELEEAIDQLPGTLDEMYEYIIKSVDNKDQALVKMLLTWLAYCEEQITVSEMTDILATVNGQGLAFSPDKRFMDPEDIISLCPGMVTAITSDTSKPYNQPSTSETTTSKNKTVQFSDPSVKEWVVLKLSSSSGISPRLRILFTCLEYLKKIMALDPNPTGHLSLYPFAQLAAKELPKHLKEAEAISTRQLLDPADYSRLQDTLIQNFDDWRTIYETISPDRTEALGGSPVYYAARFGLVNLMKQLLKLNYDVNEEGGEFYTPLKVASRYGFDEIVELLLDHNPVIDAFDEDNGTALRVACKHGHLRIVELLLKCGASVHAPGPESDGTIFTTACHAGFVNIVKELLRAGADVNAKTSTSDMTPLIAACKAGHDEIVEILLQAGAEVDIRGHSLETPLLTASREGHLTIVKTLLARGADFNHHTISVGTAVRVATLNNHIEIVKELLAHGADVNLSPEQRAPPLTVACANSNLDVARELLEHGADVNSIGRFFGSALYNASRVGNMDVVKELLARGAKLDIVRPEKGTALQIAAANGHSPVVEALLKCGANLNTISDGTVHATALQAACSSGHLEVVQFLLDNGADPNASLQDLASRKGLKDILQKNYGIMVSESQMAPANLEIKKAQYSSCQDALQTAACNGSIEIVKALLKAKANIHTCTPDGLYGTALQAAANNQEFEIVKLLLDSGATANDAGGVYGSALQAACFQHYAECSFMPREANSKEDTFYFKTSLGGGDIRIVEELLARRADVNAVGGRYCTALQAAAMTGCKPIVQELLVSGADIRIQGGVYGTALRAARQNERHSIVELLLRAEKETADKGIASNIDDY